MPQKRKILKVEPFDDIQVIGIITTNRDYKLAWYLNNFLKTDFGKEADIAIKAADGEQLIFPFYYFNAGENQNVYNLIGNKSQGTPFSNLKLKTDFFLIIRNSITNAKFNEVISLIKSIPGVQLAYRIDPAAEKNIDWVLEQIELHEFNTIYKQRKRLRKGTNTTP